MKKHSQFLRTFLMIFFIQLFSHGLAHAALPITPDDIAEIKKFASLENGKGHLLNPPRGSVAPEVLSLRNYIQQLIEELIGPDIKSRGLHYVVNVYGSDVMNAWVQQMSPETESGAEATFRKAHPDQVWPLRKLWGIADDNKPIYEIGVTTALIRALSTKDQLAFVLGHELTHLLEGHTDPTATNSDSFKKWWSSQSHETVADHLGIDKILGKYELDEALSVMDILHPKSDQALSLKNALISGASTHHSEGVRISALQFYIEYLRRFNEKASPRVPIALPANLKLNVYGRTTPENVDGDSKAIVAYFELIEELLRGKALDPKLVLLNLDAMDRIQLKSPYDGLLGSPERESYAKLLKQSMEKINSSNVSKVDKMNTFIQAMIFLGSRPSYFNSTQEWFAGFSEANRYHLEEFLVRNASGEGAWSLDNYKSLMAPLPYESRKFFETVFLGNAFGQKIFSRIMKVSANWNGLVHYLSSMESFQTGDIFQMDSFSQVFNLVGENSYPEGTLRDLYRSNFIKGLSTYSNSNMLVAQLEKYGTLAFSNLGDFKKKDATEAEKNWALAVKKSKSRHLSAYRKILFNSLVRILSTPNKSDTDRMSVSFSLAKLEIDSLNASEKERLQQAYDKDVQATLNPLPSDERSMGGFLSIEYIELDINSMDRSAADRKKILDYIRFLLISERPSFKQDIEKLSPRSREIMTKIISNLTKEEIWYLSETLSPLEKKVRQEISEVANKYHLSDSESIIMALFDIQPPLSKEERETIVGKYKNWENVVFKNYFLQLNMLQMFESHTPSSPSALMEFDVPELKRLLSNIEIADHFNTLGNSLSGSRGIPQKAAKTLFEVFYRNVDRMKKLSDLATTYERVTKLTGAAFTPSVDQETHLREVFENKLTPLSLTTQMKWLENSPLRKSLGAEFVGKQMAAYVSQSAGTDRKKLKRISDQILAKLQIQQDWPDAYQVYRENLAEIQKVQPHELTTVFTEDSRSVTEKVDKGVNLIRGMSAFSTYTRSLPAEEQIQMIEFMMGRSAKMPKSLAEAGPIKGAAEIDVKQFFLKMREELKFRTLLERSMVVNSILTGPNSLIANSAGLQKINDHLLKAVSADKRDVAATILNALAAAEGRNKSLILAYALAQKATSTEAESGLTEGLVLRSLLDSYGVPGVKLAQYLAFTNAFKDLQSTLEDYQDAAMPISYYDALLLLQKRLGASWDPAKYQVLRIIGSGSVNIAIEYLNLQTGKSEVASIARDEIEVKTKEDFRRFRLLVNKLTDTPALKKQFGFVGDLMSLIERSVALEFDKAHSFKMQKQVQKLYNRKVNAWNVRTIDAYSVLGMAILMEKAQGVGARKILKNDPATYESALRAFMEVEYASLRGVNQTENWIPLELHANPDIHDGQIMIDVATRTVTVLDFGQAVEITNQEREFALDLLAIISKAESLDSIERIVQKYSQAFQNKKAQLNRTEIAEILKSDDRMDIFVHLLAHLQKAGFQVPLSTVHWVLAANRLVKLGEKVRLSPDTSLKWLIGMRKAGVPLAGFNAGKALKDKVVDVMTVQPKNTMAATGAGSLCSAVFAR